MILKNEIFDKQKEKYNELLIHTKEYINSINKKELQAILLAGSLSRGDYDPGKYGGMIDLIIYKKKESEISALQLLGKNQNEQIPYHCIKFNKRGRPKPKTQTAVEAEVPTEAGPQTRPPAFSGNGPAETDEGGAP
jgi:hypothetical protein